MTLDDEIEAARKRLAEFEAAEVGGDNLEDINGAHAPHLPTLDEPERAPTTYGAYDFSDEPAAIAELQRRCLGKGLAERNKLVTDWEMQQRASIRPKGWKPADLFHDRYIVAEWPVGSVV